MYDTRIECVIGMTISVHDSTNRNQSIRFSTLQVSASTYGVDKPIVIGEFAAECSEGNSIQQLFEHAYKNGYAVRFAFRR